VLAAFTQDCREPDIRFSVGYELAETGRHASTEQPEAAWVQAIKAGGEDPAGRGSPSSGAEPTALSPSRHFSTGTANPPVAGINGGSTRPAHVASGLN
jgi:hypothetical protein